MDRQPRLKALTAKEQALKDLDVARALLGNHLHLATEELNPRVILRRSLREHTWVWIAGAGIGGLLLVRSLLPSRAPKFGRDNFDASATKSGLIALILSPMLVMARQAAVKYGTEFLQSYLTQHLSRPEGDRPQA